MSSISEELKESEYYKLAEENVKIKDIFYKIVQLNFDNVARVEAMISTDSDYKHVEDDGPKGKYIGSSRFWINEFKKLINNKTSKYTRNEIIKKMVIAIDNENSTHLNSDKVGREKVSNRICKKTNDELILMLKNDNGKYELIDYIQTPEKGSKERWHFSFATKFCHYLSLILFDDEKYKDNYSIYDNVLKKSLPLYVKKYLNEDVSEDVFAKKYDVYINYIDRIRKAAAIEYGKEISRNGFDHLLWYYHKGR